MQELQILRWCDVCNAENEGARVEAAERYMVAVGLPDGRRMAPRLVETCEQHGKPFREMRDLVEQVGILPKAKGKQQPEEEPPPEPEPVPEPEVPKPRPSDARSKAAARISAWGKRRTACPVCKLDLTQHAIVDHLVNMHNAKRIVQPKKCPDCGSRFDESQAMSTHRRKAHGWSHVAELVKRARR